MSACRRIRWPLTLLIAILMPLLALAQGMLQSIDLTAPAMTVAVVAREEVESLLAAAAPNQPADLTSMHLSGPEMSRLDFKSAVLRDARLNNINLRGNCLASAILGQAWPLNADLNGADLTGAGLYQSQLIGTTLNDADFTGNRLPINLFPDYPSCPAMRMAGSRID